MRDRYTPFLRITTFEHFTRNLTTIRTILRAPINFSLAILICKTIFPFIIHFVRAVEKFPSGFFVLSTSRELEKIKALPNFHKENLSYEDFKMLSST